MGVSTDANLFFGYDFEEDYDKILPWNRGEYYNDIDFWWVEANGIEQEKMSSDFMTKWIRENPLPVKIVEYCSSEVPMYMLVVPGFGWTSWRGRCSTIEPEKMKIPQEKIDIMKSFMDEFEIPHEGEPKWLLTSYYG